MVITLEQSPYKMYRICTKILVIMLLYTFAMYFIYISNTVSLFSTANLLHQHNVTIATTNYTITTTSTSAF